MTLEEWWRKAIEKDDEMRPEDEERIEKRALELAKRLKNGAKKKTVLEDIIDTPCSKDDVKKCLKPKVGRKVSTDGLQVKNDAPKLLEITDWSAVTPAQLRKYIADGYIIDWIDGYDIGPSPLTNALMQDACLEIIAILIQAGANVNAPTVLPDGTKMTPLGIVRSKEPTHENIQKELMLLRAGATDDIWQWLRNNDSKHCVLWKNIRHIGLWRGYGNRYSYRVFEPIPATPTEFTSPEYIVQCAGNIAWADNTSADPWDIFDKPASYGDINTPEAIIRNELGDKFADKFLSQVENLSFNVAMDQYYTYLASISFYTCGEHAYERISAAHKDFRDRYLTLKDWDELINITPNITAKAEYRKMQRSQKYKFKMNKTEVIKALALDFDKYDYYWNIVVCRHPKAPEYKGNSESFIDGEWGLMNINVAKKNLNIFEGGDDVWVFLEKDKERIIEMAMKDC